MNFLHYGIIPKNDFLFSIPLKPSTSNKIEVLLAYKNRLDFGIILSTKDRISYDIHDSYYLETPIIWATISDDRLISFTESNRFKITTIFSSMNLIYEQQLEQKNLKYFSVSWNRHFICAAFDQSDFLLIDITNLQNPLFYSSTLENKIILDISPEKNDNSFAFLVSEGENKFTIKFDASQKKIVKTIDEENDSISFIHSLDPKSKELYILHHNRITFKSKTILTTDSEILKASPKLNDVAHFSLSNGSLLSYSFRYDSISILTDSPKIGKFFPFSNFTLLCATDGNYIFLIKSAENKKSSRITFEEIEKFNINDVTGITQLFTYSNQLYFNDSLGNMRRIRYFHNKSNLNFIKQFKSEVVLFALKDFPLLFTTDGVTRIVKEYKSTVSFQNIVYDKKTISFLHFKKRPLQILPDGIYFEGNREAAFQDKCVMASSKGDQLVCILETNEIVLYSKNFKNVSSFEIDLDGAIITAMDISSNFIAVSSFHNEARIAQIFLLDFEFNGFGDEFSFPSKITQIFFRNNETELFLVAENGSIAKCLLTKEKGLTSEISYIFFGDLPHSISLIDEDSFSFISDSKLYLYSNNRILSTSYNNVNFVAYNGTDYFIIDKKLNLFSIHSIDLPEKLSIQNMSHFQNIIQFDFFLGFIFVLDNQGLHVRKPLKSLNKFFDVDSYKIDSPKSFAIFQKSKHNINSIRIVVLTQNNEILYFKFCSSNRKHPENDNKLILLNSNKLRIRVRMIKCWYDFIFIVLENGLLTACKYIKKELQFMRILLERDLPITSIEINKNYVWIVFGQKILSVYHPNFDCERLELISEDAGYYTSNLISVKPIDELTVAVCYEDGLVCFKEIENCVAHGFFQRNKFSQPKLHELNKINFKSVVSSMVVTESCLIYSTINGSVGFLIPITSQTVFQNLSIMQKKMRSSYLNQIGICAPKIDSLSATNGIIDFDFVNSYLKIDPNTDFISFYDVSSLTCLLQYANF